MVKSVSAISMAHTLVKGTDKAKLDAGIYKGLDGDYERLPLLILGCFCLLAAKWQKATHHWEHAINFYQLGDKMSSLCDYWDIVDFTQYCSRTLSLIAGDALQKAAQNACKAFSALVNIFETLVDFKVLKGMNIHKWKIAGSLVGGFGYAHTFYSDWTEEPSEVGLEVEEAEREAYRKSYQNQKFYDRTIIACIIAAKSIGFCSAVHALSGPARVMQFIAANKEDLLLGAYATYTVSAIASIYYGQEMENQMGKKKCQTS